MPAPFPVSHSKTKSAIAFPVTFTAGVVDIVAYLFLDHNFVARLTGITGHLGNKLATARWAASTTSAVVLLDFVGGSVLRHRHRARIEKSPPHDQLQPLSIEAKKDQL